MTHKAGCTVIVGVAVRVNTRGQRELLGLKVGASPAEPFWAKFLRRGNRRGLSGAQRVSSDCHEGIKGAACQILKAHRSAAAACTG